MRYIALVILALLCDSSFTYGQTGKFGYEFYVLAGETLIVKNPVPLQNDGERWFKTGDTCSTMHEGRMRVLFRFEDIVLAEYFFNQSPTVNQSCPSRVVTETTMTRLRDMNSAYAKWKEGDFLSSLVGQKDYREEQSSPK